MKSLLVISIFLFSGCKGIPHKAYYSDSSVTTYLHTEIDWWYVEPQDSLIGFRFRNINRFGKQNWKSKLILEFDTIALYEYYVKANIPLFALNNSKKMWCTAVYLRHSRNGLDTISREYGGVEISKIKLILKSNPQGAETYLIPNRIWMDKFDGVSFEKDDSPIQKFRVNTSSTNTYAYVDETVFVVLFKINNKYKKLIHQTKPFKVEAEQTVWINL